MLISVCCIDLCVCAHVLGAKIWQFLRILFYFDFDLSLVEMTPCRCFILEMVSLFVMRYTYQTWGDS